MYQMPGLLGGGSQGGLMNSGLFIRGLYHGAGSKRGANTEYGNAVMKQGLTNANMLGMNAMRNYQDMSQANPAAIMNMLNNAGGGQYPRQNIFDPYQNYYVNGLIGGV